MPQSYVEWLTWSPSEGRDHPRIERQSEEPRTEQEFQAELAALASEPTPVELAALMGEPAPAEALSAADDPDAPEPTIGDQVIASEPPVELITQAEEVIFQDPPTPRVDRELQPPTEAGTYRGEIREHDGVVWRWARRHRKNGEFSADDPGTQADEAWHWVRDRKRTASGVQ